MPIAREGFREIAIAALVLWSAAAALGVIFGWRWAVPLLAVWLFVLAFFRDPQRKIIVPIGALCAPADGTVTEVTSLDSYAPIGGPAIRIGLFLSLFNVHVNRSPCAGTVRSVSYHRGKFLDARDPRSGEQNESNTLVIDPDAELPGPVVTRQVAGYVARRIICHAQAGTCLKAGERFGLIKFGSRTELVIPRLAKTEIKVKVGDRVRAGLTLLAVQASEKRDAAYPPLERGAEPHNIESALT